MKKLLNFLFIFLLLSASTSCALPKIFNRTVIGEVAAGSIAALTAYAYRNNLVNFCSPQAEQKFEIQTFDPNNKKHYQQVLELLTQEKEFLLDPQEDPAQAMQQYVKGMKTPGVSTKKNPYAGLIMKIMLNNNTDVIGFATFVPDQYKMSLRTIAVDPNYRSKGIATKLLQDIASETKKKNLPAILLVAYSHNDSMLKLIEKHGYKLYAQEKKPAFSKFYPYTGKIIVVYSKTFVKKL